MKTPNSSEKVSDEYLVINSCGTENFYGRSWTCDRKDGRIDYQIIYISKGHCYVTLYGREVTLSEGDIVLFRCHEPQHYRFVPEDHTSSHFVHFTGSGSEKLLNQIHMGHGNFFHIGKNPVFEKTFADMEHAFFYNKSYEDLACSAYLLLLFSIIGKNLEGSENSFAIHDNRIEGACTTIFHQYQYPLDIDRLAKMCFLSPSRFTHLFTQVTGYSPTAFQRHIRIEKSKLLLENDDYSINEIAAEVGYDNQNYFSRIFNREVGLSPTQYRKNYLDRQKNVKNN